MRNFASNLTFTIPNFYAYLFHEYGKVYITIIYCSLIALFMTEILFKYKLFGIIISMRCI